MLLRLWSTAGYTLTVLARSKFSFEGEISSLFGGDTECPTGFDRPLTDVLAWTGVKLILLVFPGRQNEAKKRQRTKMHGRKKKRLDGSITRVERVGKAF